MFSVHDGGPRPKPLPAAQLKAAAVVDLEEYRERMDNGDRSCVAMINDGLGADPKPASADDEVTRALLTIANRIGANLRAVQADLAYLSGTAEERSLLSSVLGSMDLSTEEVREKLPELRQGIRDAFGSDGGAAA